MVDVVCLLFIYTHVSQLFVPTTVHLIIMGFFGV